MTDPLQPGDDGYLDLSAVSDEPLSPDEEAEFGAFAERVRAEGPVPGWQQRLRPEPPVAGPPGPEEPGDVVELRPGGRPSSERARNGATRYWLVGAAAAIVLIGGFLLLRDSGDEAAPVTDVADEVQPDPPARLALSVTGGNSHNCALDARGDVWCWGLNGGRIGDGTTADTATPAKVGGNNVFTAVSAGSTHTCAIDDGGAMWCWGENSFGQLGNGTFEDATVPTAVVGDITFASLSTGGTFTCGIDIDGAVWCWGNNALGATGRTGPDSNEPGRVDTDAELVEIISGGAHVCGITEDRALICWGNNSFGQLGIPDGFEEENPEGGATGSQLPATVPEISGIRQVALADWTTCVLEGNGQVTCWGHNEFGELADGTDVSRFEPQTVVDLWEVRQLSADGHHVCALGRQPDLACWGSNADGAIGPPASANTSSCLLRSPIFRWRPMSSSQETGISASWPGECRIAGGATTQASSVGARCPIPRSTSSRFGVSVRPDAWFGRGDQDLRSAVTQHGGSSARGCCGDGGDHAARTRREGAGR